MRVKQFQRKNKDFEKSALHLRRIKEQNKKLFDNIEKSNEMHCGFNSETRLDRVKFYEHSLEMFRKS